MILNFPKIKFNLILYFGWLINCGQTKYVEGRVKTLEDWAFVARFCFLSGRGRYEYHIEFERRFGEPKLLLYYDDVSQWPSVYKSGKNCQQKLAVLSLIDNQIVTLSPRSPYNIISGCTQEYKYKDSKPPLEPRTTASPQYDVDSTYFDQFLKTETTATTFVKNVTDFDYETFNLTFSGADGDNETIDIFNGTDFKTSSRQFSHDIAYENNLENNTEYMNDVEELFAEMGNNERPNSSASAARLRRNLPQNIFKKEIRGTIMVSCSNIGGFTSSRERWWYIAISNCGNSKGIDITYQFRMTNGPPGDFWHEHFSADEMNIPPILLSLSLAYTFLLIAVFICAIELKSLHLFHCTYRLYSFSVFLQWLGILLQGVAWAKYGLTGLGPYTTLGGIFMGASEVTFLTLMLLLAKGYTITRARLSSCSTVKLSAFVNLYIVAYISLFIFQAYTFDPGEVLNLYESPAGLGLAALRVFAWAAFLISMFNVIRKFPEKRSFYYPFGLLGSMWILGGPIATIFGITLLDAWVRESMMCAVLGLLAFSGHSAFLYITWPSRANKSFPYHVRTNHVGIASEEDDGADYPRHTYEPALANHNLIIPLSRRTEELLNGVYSQYLNQSHPAVAVATVPQQHCYGHSPTAPPETDNQIDSDSQSRRSMQTNSNSAQQRRLQQELENQVDSGHPSLENSVSPNETRPSSGQESPKTNENMPIPPLLQNEPVTGNLKHNPFMVNGIQRAPNKVILEPIESSMREMNRVPKHLFAARKREN